jgi:hypothetical protein
MFWGLCVSTVSKFSNFTSGEAEARNLDDPQVLQGQQESDLL